MEVSVPDDSGRLGEWRVEGQTLAFDLPVEGQYAGHWFYFAVHDAPDELRLVIRNWSSSYYSGGWQGYRPFFRLGQEWERAPAADLTPEGCEFRVPGAKAVELAWYRPYPIGHYEDWLGRLNRHPRVTTSNLGVPGLDCVRVGEPGGPTVVVIGRQHPGESMASFCIEGLASSLLESAEEDGELPGQVLMIPIMNPAGVAQGRHRLSNALVDYNRSWSTSDGRSQEVEIVRRMLSDLPRLDLFLDIHGDEETTTCDSYLRRLPARILSRRGRRLQESFLGQIGADPKSTQVLNARSAIRSVIRRQLRRLRDYRAPSPGQKQSAVDFVSRTYRVPAYTIEVSAHRADPERAREIGEAAGRALVNSGRDSR